MDKARLLELAARCEAATEPDRRIDALISQEVELPLCKEPDCSPKVLRTCIADILDGSWLHDTETVPAYTASLDAAMTLVPDKPGEWAITAASGDTRWQAWVWSDDAPNWHEAATPALALTAACLRAHAALAEQQP